MVYRRCGLPQRGAVDPEKIEAARSCIGTAYRDQRESWLQELRRVGPRAAVEEAERPVQQHFAIQEQLRVRGYLQSASDGVYGTATRAAVQALQRESEVTADGFMGGLTARLLSESAAPRVTSAREIASALSPTSQTAFVVPFVSDAAARLEKLHPEFAGIGEWILAAVVMAVSWGGKVILIHFAGRASSTTRRSLLEVLGYGVGVPATVASFLLSTFALLVRAAAAGTASRPTIPTASDSSIHAQGDPSQNITGRISSPSSMEMNWISLQYRSSLQWITVMSIDEISDVSLRLEQVKRNYPENRVRAIDSKGRVIDII